MDVLIPNQQHSKTRHFVDSNVALTCPSAARANSKSKHHEDFISEELCLDKVDDYNSPEDYCILYEIFSEEGKSQVKVKTEKQSDPNKSCIEFSVFDLSP
eukprot:CAMPEP_0117750826 /NCGR_PEP_ID=MMETSP0947-20121206/10610_1 /TAXON_ID=44440 /ORGANISM="Chattonella subsalsa, Strain CCMP2191" /LENGTH=99 /DNA_ID=CAMNT_0005569089 /DNA_START=785 /DNA_END=1084 /DNA_ORIENTATION=+